MSTSRGHAGRLPIVALGAVAAAVFGLAVGAATPAAAFPASGEASGVSQFAPIRSNTTRAQVRADAAAAMRDGQIAFGERAPSGPGVGAGQPKTRAQVIADLRNQPASERRAMRMLYRN